MSAAAREFRGSDTGRRYHAIVVASTWPDGEHWGALRGRKLGVKSVGRSLVRLSFRCFGCISGVLWRLLGLFGHVCPPPPARKNAPGRAPRKGAPRSESNVTSALPCPTDISGLAAALAPTQADLDCPKKVPRWPQGQCASNRAIERSCKVSVTALAGPPRPS